MSGLFYEVGLCTDTGRRRANNEDNMISILPDDPHVLAQKGILLIVADGLGGHDKGEVASEMVVSEVSKRYYDDAENEDVVSSLLQAIQQANEAVYTGSIEGGMTERVMGTTCTAAVLLDDHAYIMNVGDSRAYLVRQGGVRQVSLDHSWVAEQVRAGILTAEQARGHVQRNVITRCMGAHLNVEVDVFKEIMQPGDILLLCSDGLSNMVSDEEIGAIVQQLTPQESATQLVALANENGGSDNITVVVARVSPQQEAKSQ
jgi:PPM family protein phosphatase